MSALRNNLKQSYTLMSNYIDELVSSIPTELSMHIKQREFSPYQETKPSFLHIASMSDKDDCFQRVRWRKQLEPFPRKGLCWTTKKQRSLQDLPTRMKLRQALRPLALDFPFISIQDMLYQV